MFQDFDAERVGEPAEEDPSPGAYESDMMLTPEQEAAQEDQEEDGNRDKRNARTKRKGMSHSIWRWPKNTVTYKISSTAGMYMYNIIYLQII